MSASDVPTIDPRVSIVIASVSEATQTASAETSWIASSRCSSQWRPLSTVIPGHAKR